MRPKCSRSGKTSSCLGRLAPPEIDQIDAWQAVLRRDFLRSQMFLYGNREIGSAFDCRVIGDDHAFPSGDASDPGDDSAAWNLIVIHPMRGELPDLQERRERIDQRVDALARQHLSARHVTRARRLAAALADAARRLLQIVDELHHDISILAVFRRARIDGRFNEWHAIPFRSRGALGAAGATLRRSDSLIEDFAADQHAPDFAGAGADFI